jgi:hypothetical protein
LLRSDCFAGYGECGRDRNKVTSLEAPPPQSVTPTRAVNTLIVGKEKSLAISAVKNVTWRPMRPSKTRRDLTTGELVTRTIDAERMVKFPISASG